jgi:hypothetical protein
LERRAPPSDDTTAVADETTGEEGEVVGRVAKPEEAAKAVFTDPEESWRLHRTNSKTVEERRLRELLSILAMVTAILVVVIVID